MDAEEFSSRVEQELAGDGDDCLGESDFERIIRESADAILERALTAVRFTKERKRRKVPVMALYEGDYVGLARDGYLAPIPQRVLTTIKDAKLEVDLDEVSPGIYVMSMVIPT